MTAYGWTHLSILVIAIGGMACWIAVARFYRSAWILIATSLWLVNIIAFSVVRLFGAVNDPVVLNAWSLGIRLQGVITVAGTGLALLYLWHRDRNA